MKQFTMIDSHFSLVELYQLHIIPVLSYSNESLEEVVSSMGSLSLRYTVNVSLISPEFNN